MSRPTLRLCGLVLAVALAAGGIAAYARPASPGPETQLYIVRLAERADSPASAPQAALLAAEDALGAALEPRFIYRHALSGFALDLTPAQARALARLPGVRSVEPDYAQKLHSDTGPAHVGAAQADLRPALFSAALDGAQAGLAAVAGAGRGVFVYDAAARTLRVQLFYSGLSGTPTGASLRIGARGESGAAALSLTPLAVPGGYVGALPLADVPGGPTAAEVEAALFAGELYVLIGAPANQGGEIRGQIQPARGEGVLIGVIDSGINFASPSFASPAPDGYAFTNPFGPGVFRGVCDPASPRYDAAFGCNDKLVGAYTYPTTDESPDRQGRPSPRDNNGHGSHTAGIVAGNTVPAVPLGSASVGPVAGVAPRASLIVYDVCGLEPAADPQNSLRCSAAAILAAIDQAVADGVDVINFSIGGASRNPWVSADTQALLAAVSGGVFVAASAGNNGPGASTTSSPANAPWVASVGFATHGRRFTNSLAGFAGGAAAARPSSPLVGGGIGGAYGPAPVVVAAAYSSAGGAPNAGCEPFAAGVSLGGAIVICSRAGLPNTTVAANAQAAGAGGVVIANSSPDADGIADDLYPLPTVQLGFADAERLLAWARGCATCQARIGGAARAVSPADADILSPFSARGPDRSLADVLKPDLVAPGVAILSATQDANPAAPDYQLASGSSMAAPHVAGAAALLRQLHPDWTPAEIRSALMLTADQSVRREDGATLGTPHDRGGGRLDVGRAALAGLVMDQDADGFAAADPALGGDPAALNLASMAEGECAATCVFTRTVRSTLGVPSVWSASTAAPAPLSIAVTPASLALGPDESGTITITVSIGEQPAGTLHYGGVTLTEGSGLAPEARLPVAVRSAISNLPRALTLTTAARDGGYRLDARAWAIDDLATSVYGLARLVPEQIDLAQDPTPQDPTDLAAGGVYIREVILPAGSTRFRADAGPGSAREVALFLYSNADGDEIPEPGEQLCAGGAAGGAETCEVLAADLIGGQPTDLSVLLLVQNMQGSRSDDPLFVDRVTLATALVGRESLGNLAVTGPASAPAGSPLPLDLAWELAGARPGDIYIGVVGLGSGPGTPGDRGVFTLTLTYRPDTISLPLVRL